MNYLSELLRLPVIDSTGETIGVVNDMGIATGEVFPHVTSLAFRGPGKTPFMISWRKYVDHLDDTGVYLKLPATDIRFSYLQPDEVLMARDIMNKQIVDTQGLKVVRVNDIKLSSSGENQLRLLGAEVGARGLLRAMHPVLERVASRVCRVLGKPLAEDIIAWSYMDLLERSTQTIQLSVSHKTLGELHPADIADIIEQLDPRLRGEVFAQLDTAQAAEAISEFDDEDIVAEVLEGMTDRDASSMLALMDPDDAAALIDELDYEKAEKLLRLMGVKEEKAIRNLLGYEEDTAGRIMTSEFVALPASATVADAVAALRGLDEDFESIHYVYTTDQTGALSGVLSMRTLVVAERDERLADLAYRDVVWVDPHLDQEDVVAEMSKYDLVAVPVCDDARRILGIVTVDDALDVMNKEHAEDLQIAGMATHEGSAKESTHTAMWFVQRQYWVVLWALTAAAMAGIGLSRVNVAVLPESVHIPDISVASVAGLLLMVPVGIMPVPLLAAARMSSYVRNTFLAYDDREDEARPYVSFFVKTTCIGVVLALVINLCGDLIGGSLFAEADVAISAELLACFRAAGIVVVATYASAVAYLKVLFWRDDHDRNTSGASLTFVAMVLAALTYAVMGVGVFM